MVHDAFIGAVGVLAGSRWSWRRRRPALGRALKQVKEQLRSLARSGLVMGSGVPAMGNVLGAGVVAGAAGGFNYLGRFATGSDGGGSIAAEVRLGGGVLRCRRWGMPPAGTQCADAWKGLTGRAGSDVELGSGGQAADEVRALAAAWRASAGSPGRACGAAWRGRAHGVGLSAGAADAGEVEDLERRYRAVEEVLPLSPLQQGLVFPRAV